MTIKELIEILSKADQDAFPSCDCTYMHDDEDTGAPVYNHAIYADSEVAATWDGPAE